MKKILFVKFFIINLLFFISFSLYSQDKIYPLNFMSFLKSNGLISHTLGITSGDSCSLNNPEQHDGPRKSNSYSDNLDSVRWVIKMAPPSVGNSYPWAYTKICVAFTSNCSSWTVYYNIVMFDSTPSGPGPNYLYCGPLRTATNIPFFICYWYSSQDTLPTVTHAVYIGVRYSRIYNPYGYLAFIGADEDSLTPLWPCYYAEAGYPPLWIHTFDNTFKCLGIRAEGHSTLIGIPNFKNYYPDEFSLSQNYPNPFNPTTKIKFDIASSPAGEGRGEVVTLKIYDILGREVATLVNEQLKPGTYEYEWDGSNYASGIYFYKLTTSDASSPLSITKRMVLIK